MATQLLANWAVGLKYTSIPQEVTQAAVRSFYNWVGCTVGGSAHPATTIARTALARFSGAPTSRLLGSDGSVDVDAMHAALFNGIASHVHDYDDTHLDTIIHPTGPVAAALLAMAEARDQPCSGPDFITALVAGIEAECKIGKAVWPDHYDVGWHITSTTGSIGAAVAVSKLLSLNASQTAHAIGVAATQVTGLREMFGSHTKSFHPGRAAQNGLLAALLAAEGYTSSEQALEAKRGWANVASTINNLDAEIASLGPAGRWEIAQNAFKPFPCGIVVHPIIDGCVGIHAEMKKQGISPAQIEEVHADVHPLVLELTGKKTPKDGLEAKFSVYHGATIGLLFGKGTPAQYEDAVVNDASVVALRSLIKATADTSLRADECRLTVKVKGQSAPIVKHVDHAVGSLEVPMTDELLTEKFVDQCIPVLGEKRTESASAWCWDLEKQADVRRIKDVL
ncbi:hypothetical protein N7510_002956 [Penicillium lagena]|uniref:uncharacterized protein n=1 Tax=Penicillium lagena TaxID=94218 RepID=UPI002540DE1A|nr:uncharacterized protein N7510_002956 [Penicillium lagena]KAJ5618972.1 hypothetical protein N7510_002956 [Penicillium lagena]